MINKKGTLVLRDIMFMMLIVSSIFVLAGLFITDMAINYENTEMSNEWSATGTNITGNSMFYKTNTDLKETGNALSDESTGINNLISSAVNSLKGIGNMLVMALSAPNTIAGLVSGTMTDIGVTPPLPQIIQFLISGVLWIVIIFTIGSAFLRGGKI